MSVTIHPTTLNSIQIKTAKNVFRNEYSDMVAVEREANKHSELLFWYNGIVNVWMVNAFDLREQKWGINI